MIAATNSTIAVLRDVDVDEKLGAYFDNRYEYDLHLRTDQGWTAYDTKADTHYSGVWVNIMTMEIFYYSKEERQIEMFPTLTTFKDGLVELAHRYEVLEEDLDTNRNFWFDVRPSADNIEKLRQGYLIFEQITMEPLPSSPPDGNGVSSV